MHGAAYSHAFAFTVLALVCLVVGLSQVKRGSLRSTSSATGSEPFTRDAIDVWPETTRRKCNRSSTT